MSVTLNPEEARIVGCLIEKSIVTPDQYPLTLNALTNACNQKSGRNPVTAYTKGEVQRNCRLLAGKGLVRVDENFRSGVEKYKQTMCNTRFSEIQFDSAQLALVCVLMLRGPQTPGELRTNCRRLHNFADNHEVVLALKSLAALERGALVQELPRTPGRKDPEYVHLFSGAVDAAAYTSKTKPAPAAPEKVSVSDLARRVSALEAEVAALKAQLNSSG